MSSHEATRPLPADLNERRRALIPRSTDFEDWNWMSEKACRLLRERHGHGDAAISRVLQAVENAQHDRAVALCRHQLNGRLRRKVASVLEGTVCQLTALAALARDLARPGNDADASLISGAEALLRQLQKPEEATSVHLHALGIDPAGDQTRRPTRGGRPAESWARRCRREIEAILARGRKDLTRDERREITRLLQAHGIIGVRRSFDDVGDADRW